MRVLLILALAACSKESSYKSNFADVRLADRIVDAKSGEPYSGKLIAKDGEIAAIAKHVLGNALDDADPKDATGLVVVLPVAKGVPDGVASLHVDLHAKELHPEVARRSREALAVARAKSSTIKLGEATFKAGKLDGVAIEYHPGTSKKLRERTFVAGDQTGEMKSYYVNGVMRSRGSYVNGKPVGTHETWYPTQQRKSEIVYGDTPRATYWYSNGQSKAEPANGVIEEFYESGKVRSRQTYKNGVLDGESQMFYANGKTWEAARYVAGALDGPYRKWWKNGKPAHVYAYKQGKLEGDYKLFYDNGATWAVGRYENGKPIGKLERWFPDGKLGYVMHHENGRPHGPYKRWWADGKPRLEATYVRGTLDGEFKNWLEDGSVYEFATYERGVKIKTTRPETPPAQP